MNELYIYMNRWDQVYFKSNQNSLTPKIKRVMFVCVSVCFQAIKILGQGQKFHCYDICQIKGGGFVPILPIKTAASSVFLYSFSVVCVSIRMKRPPLHHHQTNYRCRKYKAAHSFTLLTIFTKLVYNHKSVEFTLSLTPMTDNETNFDLCSFDNDERQYFVSTVFFLSST